MIFNKKEMTEEDIKHQFITPAIEDRGWERSKIAMEKAITDGMINIKFKTNRCHLDMPNWHFKFNKPAYL